MHNSRAITPSSATDETQSFAIIYSIHSVTHLCILIRDDKRALESRCFHFSVYLKGISLSKGFKDECELSLNKTFREKQKKHFLLVAKCIKLRLST